MSLRLSVACAVAATVGFLLYRSRRSRLLRRRRLLITGASGYLGQHLTSVLHATEPTVEVHVAYGGLGTYATDVSGMVASLTQIDLADTDQIRTLVRSVRPDVVIHLAAVSSPAACEKNAERSEAINKPLALLAALPKSTAFVFLSTDQVYDGVGGNYAHGAAARPVNRYGLAKLAFEEALHAALPAAVSLRSSLILGPRTPGRCRKQSFLQFCEERVLKQQTTDFISDEVRPADGPPGRG